MKTLITIWERYVKQEKGSLGWEHNHISEGYMEEETEPRSMDAGENPNV